jgi:hypothetical protein
MDEPSITPGCSAVDTEHHVNRDTCASIDVLALATGVLDQIGVDEGVVRQLHVPIDAILPGYLIRRHRRRLPGRAWP